MSTITAEPRTAAEDDLARRSTRWPFYGLAAGLTGIAATMFTSQMIEPEVKAGGVAAVYAAFDDRGLVQIGASLGFVTVALLAAFAAGLSSYLTRSVGSESPWGHAIRMGLTASIGAMTITFGLKAMLAGGMPGGVDEALYTNTDVTVLHLLVDQLQWVGWWGVALAMAASVPLALKLRAIPKWLGFVGAVLSAFVAFMTFGLALPYSAGVVGGLWLVLVGAGTIGRRNM